MAEEKKVNWGLVALGGGLGIIGGYGIYYLYSKQKMINSYVDLVKDYEREYRQFISDGKIDENEQELLHNKERLMNSLEEQIKDKGFFIDLIEALAKLGIVVSGGYIGAAIIRYLIRKYPPPPNFRCPICNKTFPSDYKLRRHIEDTHHVTTTEPAAEAWEIIKTLDSWILQYIAIYTGLGSQFFLWLKKGWNELPYETKVMIIVLLIAALVIITISTFGMVAPETAPAIASLSACLV